MLPVIAYFALAWTISWLVWLPLAAPSLGLPVLPFLLQYALGAYGPALAAIIVTAATGGAGAVLQLLRRTINGSHVPILLLGLLGPFALAAAALVVGLFVPSLGITLEGAFRSPQFPFFAPPALFAFYLLTWALGEEIGWRGFALPRLEQRFGSFVATLLLALGWAVWHWPLFLFWPSFMGMGLGGAAGWFFSLLIGAFILTWLHDRDRGSLLAPILFHAGLNTVFANQNPGAGLINAIGAAVTLVGLVAALDLLRKR